MASYGDKKVLGIKFPRDIDAIALGAGVMFVMFCIPTLGNKFDAFATTVRTKLGGKA